MENQSEIERLRTEKCYSMDDLLTLMRILRSPEGCPWDREQSHESIRKCLIEECYEVCEAIDRADPLLLREELGDLLFQVVFHARIAEEDGLFTFADVVSDVTEKMVVRHPHVFGEGDADTTEAVLTRWDAIKMETKHQKTAAESIDSVARTLPALMRAEKVAHKVRKYRLLPLLGGDSNLFAEPDPTANTPSVGSGDAASLGESLFRLAADCDLASVDAEEALTAVTERIVAKTVEKSADRKD